MTDTDTEKEHLSPEDYHDLDFSELQIISDYIMKSSIPQGLTIQEMNRVVECLTNLINTSHYNLNLLRSLAGDGDYPFPVDQRGNNDNTNT